VKRDFTPEEIFAKTGAVVSSDPNDGGSKEPEMQVDLASYYPTDTVLAKFVADGGLDKPHGLSGPTPTNYASQQTAQIEQHGTKPAAVDTGKDA
jgi:hypothetical protein